MESIEKIMQEAEAYVPISKKAEFVKYCAERCFDKLNITAASGNDTLSSMPPMWKENPALKARYMMGGLLKLYLKQNPQTDENDEWLLTEQEYDRWAAAHILNQIERMKSNASLRDKCFDLLQDYKTLEKMLNTEVYGLIRAMNDSVSRIIAQIQASTTPESMKNAMTQLEQSKKDYEKYMKESGKAKNREVIPDA